AATPALDLDAVTVVSEPVRAESHESATPSSSPVAESNTVEKSCQMDCGACATVTSRPKRDNVVLGRFTHESPSVTTIRFENRNSVHSSNEYWTQISPRGPPSVTL
ncbi:MAG TPA: hypothetical protein VFS77_12790, partial [Pyrinomonadaceae bacterium]|nr:hypothetical protein [Pyrinomonadaceae bacterium]